MPCYRCGARQTDPVRGPSPWKRGVRAGEQVLVCPECQRTHDWGADVEHCPRCGSVSLSRVLGETTCRTCGQVADSGAPPARRASPAATGGLSDEVEAAIRRVLGGVGRRPGGA